MERVTVPAADSWQRWITGGAAPADLRKLSRHAGRARSWAARATTAAAATSSGTPAQPSNP